MKKGFTLVELVIVIIIVGILSLVAISIYRKYVQEAKFTEGKAFLSAVYTAQRLYYLEHGFYYTVGSGPSTVTYDTVIGIDARNNKFFTSFQTFASSAWAGSWQISAFYEPSFLSFNIFWWSDTSKEGTPVTVSGITGANSVIPPLFSYGNAADGYFLL